MDSTEHFGITRAQYKTCGDGWLVRLYLPGENQRPIAQRYFADKKHGGTDQAFAVAQVWRDKKALEHGVTRRKRDGNGYFLKYRRGSKLSGMLGVNLLAVKNEQGHFRTLAWEARFMVDGKQKNRSYSIFKYGYEAAWRLAALERSRHDGQPVPEKAPDKPDWIPR